MLVCSNEEFSSICESIDGIRLSTDIVKVPRGPLLKVLEDRETILSKFQADSAVERYFKKKAAKGNGLTADMIHEIKAATKSERKGVDYYKVPHVAVIRLLAEYSELCGILRLE